MRTLLTMCVAVALFCAASPARAHHSFAAEFDEQQPITLRGTLSKMDWVNPHGWLHIEVRNADGTVATWAIEAGGATQLMRNGLRRTDFPAGIELTVQGFRARNGSNTASGQTVTTADGRNFFLGPPERQAP